MPQTPHASADAILCAAFSLGGAGPRVAVKDSIDIAGWPTRAGSAALADALPATGHADVVAAVLAAGGHIVGKANMHELAFGVTGVNAYAGTALNPLFPDRVPGGSSSGSAAAVAAGIADIGLGTDTGGSVRVPACCCGVYGFKPTFGRVSRAGVMPQQTTLDCVGPFARDAAMLTQAMAMIDPTFTPVSLDAPPVLGRLDVSAAPEVAEAVDQALAEAAPVCRSVTIPGLDEAYAAGLAVINAETWAAAGTLTQTGKVGADVNGRLLAASRTTAQDLAAAEAVRARVTAAVDAALAGVDALVLPTMPDVPPKLSEAGDARAAIGITALVRAFNLTGHPALSLPLRTAAGLPAGLQIVGRKGADAQVCAIAAWIEARLPLAQRVWPAAA